MKALEKDRKRRYETPSSLATDIRSHLTGGTVLAAPPSLWYRTQKFLRRNRRKPIFIAASLLLALLPITVGAIVWGWRNTANSERLLREQQNRFRGSLIAVFTSAFAETGSKDASGVLWTEVQIDGHYYKRTWGFTKDEVGYVRYECLGQDAETKRLAEEFLLQIAFTESIKSIEALKHRLEHEEGTETNQQVVNE